MGTTQGFSCADEFIGWETIPTVSKPEVAPRLIPGMAPGRGLPHTLKARPGTSFVGL